MELVQRHYARWLVWGVRAGLGLLLVGFLSLVAMRAATGVEPAWAGLAVMAAIAILATCSIPALLAAARSFAKTGERWLAAICVLEVVALVLAASGLLTAH